MGGPPPSEQPDKACGETIGARIIQTSKSLFTALAISLFALPGHVRLHAQTLARPGWVGSGLTAQTWFKHAIVYQIDTRTFSDSNADGIGDLKGITQRLDYIHTLGVDAILLKPFSTRDQLAAIDPAVGTFDDFDELTLQASRLKVRVLLDLPTPDSIAARFWLTRGVAGFYIAGGPTVNSIALEKVRKLLSTNAGQRILITDADPNAPLTAQKPPPNELVLERAVLRPTLDTVPTLHAALDQSQTLFRSGIPILAIDRPVPSDPRLARITATATLLNRSAALVTAGQELGFTLPAGSAGLIPWGQPAAPPPEELADQPAKPAAPVVSAPDKYTPYVPYVRPAAPKKAAAPDPSTAAGQDADPTSLLNFYRDLGRLHHGITALRDGEETTFNYDERGLLVWLRKPAAPSALNPPVLVACNLTGSPAALALKTELAHLQLHGSFLRTILRSDDLMGGVSLDAITLPAFGVYVGSLRY